MALKPRSHTQRDSRAEHILDRSPLRNSHVEDAHFLQNRFSRRHPEGPGRMYYDDKVACRAGGCRWDGRGTQKSSSIIRGEDIKQIECRSTRSLVYNDINARTRECTVIDAYVFECVRACVRPTRFTRFSSLVCTRARVREREKERARAISNVDMACKNDVINDVTTQ